MIVSFLATSYSFDLSLRVSKGTAEEVVWGRTGALRESMEEVITAWSLSAGMLCCLEMTFFFSPLRHSRATDDLNSPSPSLSGDRKAPVALEMRQMLMELWV